MPHTPHEFVLLDAKAATGASDALGIGGSAMRYGNKGSTPNQNQYPVKFKVRCQLTDSTTGATATVKIQGSDDNSSYSDIYSFPMSIASGGPNAVASGKVFVTSKRWIRANVTALAGGSAPAVNVYCMVGTLGV